MSVSGTIFDPTRATHIGGFDRRGCVASLSGASGSGVTISGYFSDAADFVTYYLYDIDDLYGHLQTSRYLPSNDLANVVLDFDLAISAVQNPTSQFFQSVPWGKLSYINKNGTSGTVQLPVTSVTGAVAASRTYTVSAGSAGDRVQVIYQGNVVFDVTVASGETSTSLCAKIVASINSPNWTAINTSFALAAIQSGASFTIYAAKWGIINTAGATVSLVSGQNFVDLQPGSPFIINNQVYTVASVQSATSLTLGSSAGSLSGVYYTSPGQGADGNKISVYCQGSSSSSILPSGQSSLLGGVDPASMHVRLDFSALGLANAQQIWFTLAPGPVALPANFSFSLSNMAISGTGTGAALRYASGQSVVVPSTSPDAQLSGSWSPATGFYYRGMAHASQSVSDTATIKYSSQVSHDLYLGTSIGAGGGTFGVTVDGVPSSSLSMSGSNTVAINTRRLIAASVAPGVHTVVLTNLAGGSCIFDYLHAVAASANPPAPVRAYPALSSALDFDTDQTYKISPDRNLFVLSQLGFQGDIDVYTGVFFAHKRVRSGGSVNVATITTSGAWGTGDAVFVTVGNTSLGAGAYAWDTNLSLMTRLANGINATFQTLKANIAGGSLQIQSTSAINAFDISVSKAGSGSISLSGSLATGNEGVWQIDASQTLPLNSGFTSWLADFTQKTKAAGLTFTLAFSQELLAPPDANTAAGAWTQRYPDGATVLTATGFGSWGAGIVNAVSSSGGIYTVTQNGHGYITGNTVHVASGAYPVTVLDANRYTVPGLVSLGEATRIDLATSQCSFSTSTVAPYLTNCYLQAAGIITGYGVTPHLQLGEILHWFFSNASGMAFYDANQKAAAVTALGRDLALFTDPNSDPSLNSHADANFLRSRLQAYIHGIVSSVKASYPAARFEWLYPYDVNWQTSYQNSAYPFPIGGALNYYVNTPTAYLAPGSDIDNIKMEALAWGTSYRSIDNAKNTIVFPFTVGSWPKAQVSYLIPWGNGGCAWQAEYVASLNARIAGINFWALDHAVLLSWSGIPAVAGFSSQL